MRNKLPPLENYINGSIIVEGVPVLSEIMDKPLFPHQEHQQAVLEKEQAWRPNVAIAIPEIPEEQEKSPLPFMCKHVSVSLLNFILFGGQIFIQLILLGKEFIYQGLIISYGLLFFCNISSLLGKKCKYANFLHASFMFIALFFIISTICFICEIVYPIRYQFHNPEANNLIHEYDELFNKIYKHNQNESQSNKDLSDICKTLQQYYGIYFDQQSYYWYCNDLLSGRTEEKGISTTLQKGLIVYYVAALIFNIPTVYYLGKINNQQLDYLNNLGKCYPAEKVNDFFGFIDEFNNQNKKVPKKPPYKKKKKSLKK